MFRIIFTCEAKINLIKIIRGITSLGLRDAKNMVEQGAILEAHQLEPFLRMLRADVAEHNRNSQYRVTYNTAIELWERPQGPVELPATWAATARCEY